MKNPWYIILGIAIVFSIYYTILDIMVKIRLLNL